MNQEKEGNNLFNFRLLEHLLALTHFPYFSKKKKKKLKNKLSFHLDFWYNL